MRERQCNTSLCVVANLTYHPCKQVEGKCLMGSFTGAVPCQRVTQGYKGWLSTDGHRAVSIKA